MGDELGLDFHCVELEGYLIGEFAIDFVAGAHFDFIEVVHHVGFGDEEVGDAVEHAGIAQGGNVDPAAATRTTCGGAIFVTHFAEFVADFVEEFGGERTSADAGAIGLGDAHDATDA